MTKIIDNFLDKKYFEELQKLVLGVEFSWFFQKSVNTNQKDKDLYFYLTHTLYADDQSNSNFLPAFQPLLDKIDYKKLIRVKVNLYPRTEQFKVNEPHIDYTFANKGFLFYFNTCDSKTILHDCQIDCIENRGVYFDPTKPHSSSSCTNNKARFSVNVNYI
tara:strand:- start:535 stop:1017 length:483 start_codon:yes stop_codon:yes gene_type:complete